MTSQQNEQRGKRFMVYGCTGYTGKLIAARVAALGLSDRCVLAGRNPEKVASVAEKNGVENWTSFPIDNVENVTKALETANVGTVLWAAGPFNRTIDVTLRASLQAKCNYLDITGESEVMEKCYTAHEEAQRRGIVIAPAVGFDVVPTDLLGCRLAASGDETSPETTVHTVKLAIRSAHGKVSPGTLKSVVDVIAMGPHAFRQRTDGALKSNVYVPTEKFPFSSLTEPTKEEDLTCVAFPLGDHLSLYRSTGVPNIRTYFPGKASLPVRPLSAFFNYVPLVHWMTHKLIDHFVKGLPEEDRANAFIEVYGAAFNPAGEKLTDATLRVPEGYSTTAGTSIDAVLILMGDHDQPAPEAGAVSPGQLFPADYLETAENWRFNARL